jgi:hypothetical protein
MAVVKLTIGAVNITNYLIVRVRKVSSPLVEEAREVYAPARLTGSLNIVVPASATLDATVYYVDFYESLDGIGLGTLLGEMIYDAKIQVPISETRYYKAGGIRTVDPVADQANLVDPYLNGKNITKIFKYGYGPLWPPGGDTDSDKEYSILAGGGFHLEQGQTFNFNEKYSVEITYVSTFDQTSSNAGLYDGVTVISVDTTLTSAHRNKRLKCEGGSARLSVTLEDITTVPGGKFYQFSCNGGSQKKVRIICAAGNTIFLAGNLVTEISIGLGESVRLEKYDDGVNRYWEAINGSAGLLMVGEIFIKRRASLTNSEILDGTIISGDDEPRLYDFVRALPVSDVIINDLLAAQPAGKEGLWVRQATGRGLRKPNYQGFSQKGLASFSAFGTDTSRTYDYPGGGQPENVGGHKHWTMVDAAVGNGGFPTPPLSNTSVVRYFNKNGGAESMYAVGDAGLPTVGLTSNPTTTFENTVKNIGEIFYTRT